MTRAQLLYPYPQYGQVTITDIPAGRQRYDSAQFKLKPAFLRRVHLGGNRRYLSGMNRWVNGVFGGWTTSGVSPTVAKNARLTDAQRDALAPKNGRDQYDISHVTRFDTSIFPRTARSPYVLQDYPTRFPDVRTKPLNVANFPWFGNLDGGGANVTNSKLGNQTRIIVGVMKIFF